MLGAGKVPLDFHLANGLRIVDYYRYLSNASRFMDGLLTNHWLVSNEATIATYESSPVVMIH